MSFQSELLSAIETYRWDDEQIISKLNILFSRETIIKSVNGGRYKLAWYLLYHSTLNSNEKWDLSSIIAHAEVYSILSQQPQGLDPIDKLEVVSSVLSDLKTFYPKRTTDYNKWSYPNMYNQVNSLIRDISLMPSLQDRISNSVNVIEYIKLELGIDFHSDTGL